MKTEGKTSKKDSGDKGGCKTQGDFSEGVDDGDPEFGRGKQKRKGADYVRRPCKNNVVLDDHASKLPEGAPEQNYKNSVR